MPAINRNSGPTNNPEVTRQAPPVEPEPAPVVESTKPVEDAPKDQQKPAEKPATARTGKTGTKA